MLSRFGTSAFDVNSKAQDDSRKVMRRTGVTSNWTREAIKELEYILA